jgi:wobble nucleotide-excising tRNase
MESTERQLAAAKEQQPIRTTPLFDAISLPQLDSAALNSLLQRDLPTLDSAAADQVQRHLAGIGPSGEAWASDGFRRLPPGQAGPCPFCAQNLSGSTLIAHYRTYFSEAYSNLKQQIAEAITSFSRVHGDESPAAFERAIRLCGERRHFWARFCSLPELAIDTADIARAWKAAREAVLAELHAKQAAPLDSKQLATSTLAAIDAYQQHRTNVAQLNRQLQEASTAINLVKEQAAAGNVAAIESDLARLRAVQTRYSPAVAAKCLEYLNEKAAKVATERLRDQSKDALSQYRQSVFPLYQSAINDYLRRFNANFRLGSVEAADTRGGPTCNYSVVINDTPVAIAGTPMGGGTPSFKTILSSGDRNTLALAFFFASLDQDPALADRIVVIDDPITSLDDHRSLTTVQEIRRLVQRTAQVIVLSHSKPFLCRLWAHPDPSLLTAIQVTRDGTGSTLSAWDVNQDCITEHDRRHTVLREYMLRSSGNNREVAQGIRPLIEAFFRVAYPEHFPPSTLLGPFRAICEQRSGTAQQILSQQDTQELRELVEYANRFHHDTNPAWETEVINDSELLGFVQRAITFARR